MSESHKKLEKNISLMAVIIVIVVLVGGAVEILPLVFDDIVREPTEGIKPYPALQLAGRDVYVREGCYLCHSQMIRPFRSETERYGPYSVAGESVYDRPFQWGSKRTGPDLARVGGRYSDDWHRIHLINPRDVVPESNMPGFPWFEENMVDGQLVQKKMQRLKTFGGDPYTDEEIASAPADVEGKTEMDAMIAYLQALGHARSGH
jgi:cytochrome c oxidase cbb3-type subunit 2